MVRRGVMIPVVLLFCGIFLHTCKDTSLKKQLDEQVSQKSEQAVALCMHKVSVEHCFICDPKLRDPKRLWCKEHNAYEDRCFQCHPEAREMNRLYCKEHSLYEDECILCHPELITAQVSKSSSNNSKESNNTLCTEHRVAEQECGICHPDLLNSLQSGQGLKIRFKSIQSAQKAGIVAATPEVLNVQKGVSFPGRTLFNENNTTIVVALFGGIVMSLKVDLGAYVTKGQILATIASSEVAQLVSDYRSADYDVLVREKEYIREKRLFEQNVSSSQETDNAASAWNSAKNRRDALKQRMQNAGFSNHDISEILQGKTLSSDFEIRSQASGTVTQKSVSIGQSVESQTILMHIVDLSSLWITVFVPVSQALSCASGQVVNIEFDDGKTYQATIDWVSPEIDRTTGMVAVRAKLPNPKNILKAGMYCRVFLPVHAQKENLAIPDESVASIDGKDVVFTKLESDLFEIRPVVLRSYADKKAFISDGLRFDDSVVVRGCFIVKSEFLKSKFGAGCVDD